jgi:two-component system sensor histidine kinase RegB
MQLHLRGMWVAFGVAASFIVYFLLRVRRDLESREADLAEAQRRVGRQERLASLATLAAGAAHELATPLATIALAARELERHLERAQADATSLEDVHLIRAQVDRCRAILDGMAADAGQSAGESASDVGVVDLLRAAADGLRAAPPVEIDVAGLNGQRVRVPPRAVAQAIKSLLKNAQDASSEGAAVSLRAGVNGGSIAIEVIDRGKGMPADVLARAGEPFFTTKEPGRGMGLGLFLTRTLVERLGGELTLSSEAGAGTRALVKLPLA